MTSYSRRVMARRAFVLPDLRIAACVGLSRHRRNAIGPGGNSTASGWSGVSSVTAGTGYARLDIKVKFE
jgi:hypothetical protein